MANEKKKKIIQIMIDSSEGGSLFALADDGTVWQGWWEGKPFQWKTKLPALPEE